MWGAQGRPACSRRDSSEGSSRRAAAAAAMGSQQLLQGRGVCRVLGMCGWHSCWGDGVGWGGVLGQVWGRYGWQWMWWSLLLAQHKSSGSTAAGLQLHCVGTYGVSWEVGRKRGRVRLIACGWARLDETSRGGWQQGDMLPLMLGSLFCDCCD